MNELREQIADVIGEDMSRDTELWHPEAKYTQADRILAIIADAMLSGESLVAAVDAGYQIRPNLPSHYRATTQAQLTAIGITGAGQEGGEGE